jgi:hypothetical protein
VRLQVGVGLCAGASVKAGGLVKVGLTRTYCPRNLAFGWDYGRPARRQDSTTDVDFDLSALGVASAAGLIAIGVHNGYDNDAWASLVALAGLPVTIQFESDALPVDALRHRAFFPTTSGTVRSQCILPGLLSQVRVPQDAAPGKIAGRDKVPRRADPWVWIWSERGRRFAPRAALHAFDVEASVYLGGCYVRAGVSLGEVADFLAGLVGLDLAGDDAARAPAVRELSWPPRGSHRR